MRELELLIQLVEKAMPFLEHRMEESPQPDLVQAVTGIHRFLELYYSKNTEK
jgi:hypothetical protein